MKSQILKVCNPRKFWSERLRKKEDYPTINEVYDTLSKANKDLINKFLEYKSQDPISKARVSTIKTNMVKFAATFEKDISAINVKDMREIMKLITDSKFKPATQILLICDIKQFYKFLDKQKKRKRFAELFEDIKMPKLKAGYKFEAKDLITEEKFTEILKACMNSRDRFFVALLRLDTACRPSELRNLKWEDLAHDEFGYFIRVRTLKNSGDKEYRTIRLIKSEPYLLRWMEDYPGKKDKENFIFVRILDNVKSDLKTIDKDKPAQFGKSAMQALFNRIKKRIGFEKHMNAYLFRHSLLTDLVRHSDSVMSIPIIKQMAGHKKHSNVIANYTHISNEDVQDAQLKKAGRKSNSEKAKLELSPIICPSCQTVNVYNAESCLNEKCRFLFKSERLVMAIEKEKEFEVMKKQLQKLTSWVAENPTQRSLHLMKKGDMIETEIEGNKEVPILAEKDEVYGVEEDSERIQQTI